MLLGTIVNFAAIILGGGIGTLLKKGVSQRFKDSLMNGMGLCVLFVGISGLFDSDNALLVIISVALGGIIGELFNIDFHFSNFAHNLEKKLNKGENKFGVAQGFISASLLFCVGAMAVVGSLESGLQGNHNTIFTKSLMDGIVSVSLASSLGIGVMFSSVPVLLYQGLITVMAGFLQPLLSDTTIADMTAIGSLLIIATSFNMLKLTDIKVLNYVPAIFVPVLYVLLQKIFM